jgi:mannosyltransferase
VLLGVAALTLVGLVLRLAAIGQGLDGDEFFTYTQTVDRPLEDVLGADQENNPPLFYMLAWAAAKLGDPTVWIRLPSLVLGAASIPVVYALGVRSVGRAPGLVGAAVVALSPFAAFYGVEARGYAALVFFSALATLSLLTALDTGRRLWWALYALASAGVLYTHYLGVFVLLAQAAWSLWANRRQVRPLLWANGAVALATLPLLPSVVGERGSLLPEGPLTPGTSCRVGCPDSPSQRPPWGRSRSPPSLP